SSIDIDGALSRATLLASAIQGKPLGHISFLHKILLMLYLILYHSEQLALLYGIDLI
ncbi:hypothetical protein ACJX0J_034218, partial [Zea mays]